MLTANNTNHLRTIYTITTLLVLVTIFIFTVNQKSSAQTPITITSCSQLQDIGIDPTLPLSGSYNLTTDINCFGTSTPGNPLNNTGLGFNPIGDAPSPVSLATLIPFTGIFDGGGFKITNLFINNPAGSVVGLFSNTDGATISNLTLENVNITAGKNIGALAGYAKNTTIANIHITGSVTGVNNLLIDNICVFKGSCTGGLAGATLAGSSIDNSSFDGNVNSLGSRVGGLVGTNSQSTFSNSHTSGNVSSNNQEVGGLVGSQSFALISKSFSSADVTGSKFVGGLVGNNFKDHISGVSIDQSYATGSATVTILNAAGLVGLLNSATIRNSYATTKVTGSNSGGLVGNASNSFNIINSFFDINTTGRTNATGNRGTNGTGLSTVDMKKLTTYTNSTWNIAGILLGVADNTKVWNIVDTISYPFFPSQLADIAQDPDTDFIPSSIDNCPNDPNSDQADLDIDGIGDACDVQTCGDNTKQTPGSGLGFSFNEACDDGNTVSGDGCSADCQTVEAGFNCPPLGGMCIIQTCGNGMVDSQEVCDGTNLNSNSCKTLGLGFTGGNLACNIGCLIFDISACTTCGNNIVEPPEQCDGTPDCTAQCTKNITDVRLIKGSGHHRLARINKTHFAWPVAGSLPYTNSQVKNKLNYDTEIATKYYYDASDTTGPLPELIEDTNSPIVLNSYISIRRTNNKTYYKLKFICEDMEDNNCSSLTTWEASHRKVYARNIAHKSYKNKLQTSNITSLVLLDSLELDVVDAAGNKQKLFVKLPQETGVFNLFFKNMLN